MSVIDSKPPSLNEAAVSETSLELPRDQDSEDRSPQRRQSNRLSVVAETRPTVGHEGSFDPKASLDLPSFHSPSVRRRSDRPSVASGVRPTNVEDLANYPSVVPSQLVTDHGRRRSEVSTTVHISLEHPSQIHAPVFEEDVTTAPTSYNVTPAPSVHRDFDRLELDDTSSYQVPPTELSRQQQRAIVHFTAVCFAMFLNGWNDGTTGPLLPVMQSFYHLNFTLVSLIFVTNTIGYVGGALSNVYLNERIGFGKTMVVGSVLQTLTYSLQAPAGPFPLMAASYAIGGFGIALQNAQGCGFVGSLRDPGKMGILHASYGIGAFSAPLMSAFFATQRRWSFHFLVSTGLSLLNLTSLLVVFRLRTQDQIMAAAGIPLANETENATSANSNRYRAMIGMRVLHFLALFALIYVGTEVTLGGWIVTYIIEERKGGSSAGYISSGFFGGLALGRIVLMWLNKLIGEHRIMYFYALAAIGLEITVWFVPSLVGNAVAVSFIGLVLGPMYPILMNHSARILPRWLLTGSMGVIGGVGQAGSALLPFITGVIAAKEGIRALQPLLISMMGCLVVLWFIIPKGHSRVD